ncbi:L-type lectin-domain containing receptor kinase IX.1-like [Eucalyptus grandis]|uniref:L-type lectin-domain containing receptor kinase IX.1-like n=1 Tax=Eucalyptus grandis TaxID=71139 RepID=UPI00192EFDA9|nr:L-type lectin-domain containing receptor kinase IX.1-like [Eucalyptus grandis]
MIPITQLAVDQHGKDLVHSSRQATYHKPMHLWDVVTVNMADFSTKFTFVINSLGSEAHGDGFAFFLVPFRSQIPDSFAQNLSVLLIGDSGDSSSGENVSSIPSIVKLRDKLPGLGASDFSGSSEPLSGQNSIDTWESFSGPEVRLDIVSTNRNKTTRPVVISVKRSDHTRSKRNPKDEISREGNEGTVSIGEELKNVSGGRKFCYKELVVSTHNFADDRLLGRGGLGKVFKGYLTNAILVAIKKITPNHDKG